MSKENEDWCHYSDMPSPNAYNKTKKMEQQDKIAVFVERLQNVGVELKLGGNYPWIYIDNINGKPVTETFQANHGFTLAFTPTKKGQEIEFTDITEIFKLIRKYCT
tara:strand:+ start:59 stop:376 length:318 start_codon:yes stop_codon:yes gene_type:complete